MQRTYLALALVAGACNAPVIQTMPDMVEITPHIDFASESYTLQPGEEKYFCYTMRLPAGEDIVLTKFVPTYGKGTHHILFSQAIATEPEGFSECGVLTKITWVPLYAGGLNSGPLAAPTGAGFKPLTRGQQLVMQLHLQNATTKPITDTTSMRMDYVAASKVSMAAGIFGYDNRMINLPVQSMGEVTTMSCKMDKKLDVFAVLPHMHKRGRHIQLSRGATVGAEVLFDASWSFDDQPVTPVKVTINPGDTIWLRCTHDNPTDSPIVWGESSDTEMCASVFYYTPFTNVDGCISQ